MLLVFVGIPAELREQFQTNLRRILPSAGVKTILQFRRDPARALSSDDVAQVESKIVERLSLEPHLLNEGAGLIYICPAFRNAEARVFRQEFFPTFLLEWAELPYPLALNTPTRKRMFANDLREPLRLASLRLYHAIRAMTKEAQGRLRRSPLLLPRRNFASPMLDRTLTTLFDELPATSHPTEKIQECCRRFEQAHPFQPERCFVNESGVKFKSPGRDLHGVLRGRHEDTHPRFCRLNGLLRLGAPIQAGFHYDCIKSPALRGDFPNCHGVFEQYVGRPHLNIFPSDFIR